VEELTFERVTAEAGRVVFGDLREPSTLSDVSLQTRRPVVVQDEALEALHPYLVKDLHRGLGAAGPVISLPGSEGTKSLSTVSRLVDFFLSRTVGPDDYVVAVGGGTITDVAGFAASVTHRGLLHVRIPSTLLGQLDASIGWKTGVNHHGLKNVVGTYSVPHLTAVDVRLLSTLPAREVRSGLAEAIKVALVGSAPLFGFLEENAVGLLRRDMELLDHLAKVSVGLKLRLLDAWERHRGVAGPMSLGHTVGHAIELLSGRGLRHGEAVAVGIATAARLAAARRIIDDWTVGRITGLLTLCGLPTALPSPAPAEIEAIQARIPGFASGDRVVHRLVVPSEPGSVTALEDVTWPEIRSALSS
jgi:3-dehydroquinate synthase